VVEVVGREVDGALVGVAVLAGAGHLGDCGQPIGVGRQTRTINRRMRRAINKRSGGCCEWAGCNDWVYLEAHHVWHWEHGGPTELLDLIPAVTSGPLDLTVDDEAIVPRWLGEPFDLSACVDAVIANNTATTT
jgi:hypothetical protein